MPQGTVFREDGPESHQKTGQIISINGDIYPFFNTKHLRQGEPIIFDIIRTKLTLKVTIGDDKYDYKGMIPMAVVPLDFEVHEKDSKKKWPKKLRERWEKEWEGYADDEEIEQKMGVKLRRSVKNHPHYKL